MNGVQKITVRPNGSIEFIHADELAGLLEIGESTIRRASHVEPHGIAWEADLSPVGGPVLGPFKTRREALAAEVEYLERMMEAGPLPVA